MCREDRTWLEVAEEVGVVVRSLGSLSRGSVRAVTLASSVILPALLLAGAADPDGPPEEEPTDRPNDRHDDDQRRPQGFR